MKKYIKSALLPALTIAAGAAGLMGVAWPSLAVRIILGMMLGLILAVLWGMWHINTAMENVLEHCEEDWHYKKAHDYMKKHGAWKHVQAFKALVEPMDKNVFLWKLLWFFVGCFAAGLASDIMLLLLFVATNVASLYTTQKARVYWGRWALILDPKVQEIRNEAFADVPSWGSRPMVDGDIGFYDKNE